MGFISQKRGLFTKLHICLYLPGKGLPRGMEHRREFRLYIDCPPPPHVTGKKRGRDQSKGHVESGQVKSNPGSGRSVRASLHTSTVYPKDFKNKVLHGLPPFSSVRPCKKIGGLALHVFHLQIIKNSSTFKKRFY